MPACELRPATQYDTDAVYALICELKQAEFDHQAFRVGFNANLRDPNMRYHLALLDGEVVGMIGLHLQFHLQGQGSHLDQRWNQCSHVHKQPFWQGLQKCCQVLRSERRQ